MKFEILRSPKGLCRKASCGLSEDTLRWKQYRNSNVQIDSLKPVNCSDKIFLSDVEIWYSGS